MNAEPLWLAETRAAGVGSLHADWPAPETRERRAVMLCRVEGGPALVLGSSQREKVVDTAAAAGAGVQLVHRRSGGGAVLVAPGGQVWLEVWIPRGDPLWDDDIVRAPQWLGGRWRDALVGLGVDAAELVVHRGRLEETPWSSLVCFAGVGPGEVTVGARKIVGLSQRRTSAGARFSTMALASWAPARLASLLRLEPHERDAVARDTDGAACGLVDVLGGDGGPATLRAVEASLLAQFPAASA